MVRFFVFVLSICLVIILVPQTPTRNIVTRRLSETGWFLNYAKAQQFLYVLNWCLISLFLILLFFLNLR